MINLNSSDVQISHFLKADSYNEEYRIKRRDSESEDTKIINGNKEFFENIILKYEDQPSDRYYIQQINSNNKIYSNQLNDWIEKNIYNAINDTLFYIEGYAGCGKTTWVQSILYKYHNCYMYKKYNINIKDDYINFYSSFTPGSNYSSDVIRFNIINSMVINMISFLKQESGIEILDQFCSIISDKSIGILNNRLPNIARFLKKDCLNESNNKREETYFYQYAKSLRNNRENEESFIDIFRENINKKDTNGSYIFSIIDILCIDFICRIAQNYQNDTLLVCYDNLDIIDDLETLSHFISDLETLKSNISNFREIYNDKIPVYIIFVTCRKITSVKLDACGLNLPSNSIINESLKNDSNEAAERDLRRENTFKIELSYLYDYEEMVTKRVNYFIPHLERIVDYNDINRLKVLLKRAMKLPKKAFDEINYPGLWNHNYRACNNILSKIITNYPEYYNAFKKNSSANSSILLHTIIKILNSTKDWSKSLGYLDRKITTLSRLILTYLYNKKKQGSNSTSILDLIEEFGLVSFTIEDDNTNDTSNNVAYICVCLQNMLNRLPSDNEEIWRRPLYYKYNALICNNQKIHTELINQWKTKDLSNSTSFIISDEGSTFIEKVVPQFEFYSARLNTHSIPLFYITKKEDLKLNIERVYIKVEECCKYQIIFMNRYNEMYKINNINDYLSKDFHPITMAGDKQLHIIRVIFSHISHLNSLRDYLRKTKKLFNQFNCIIVEYIYKYLKLYEDNFYELMIDTIGEYNNEVWNEIAIKYNMVAHKINEKASDMYGVSIERIKENDDVFTKKEPLEKQELKKLFFNEID